MEPRNTYPIKPLTLSMVLLVLVSVVLSCLFSTLNDFSAEAITKPLTEKTVKDSGPERESEEEKEFFGEVLFSTAYCVTKFNTTCTRISGHALSGSVPQVSLDIPVPPPKA